MSKLAVFVGVTGAVAVGALAVWNISLQGQLEDLRSDQKDTVETVTKVVKETASGTSTRSGAVGTRRTQQLETRLQELEAWKAVAAPAIEENAAPETDTPIELDASIPVQFRSTEFRDAVNGVIDQREADRRRERMEKEAERVAKFLVRDMELTESQVADVQRTLLDHMLQREQIRRDGSLEPEQRRTRNEELEAQRDTALEGIVGADLFAQLDQRRQMRARRGMGGTLRRPDKETPRKRREKREKKRDKGAGNPPQ